MFRLWKAFVNLLCNRIVGRKQPIAFVDMRLCPFAAALCQRGVMRMQNNLDLWIKEADDGNKLSQIVDMHNAISNCLPRCIYVDIYASGGRDDLLR